jgi:hypothetical protein
MYMLVNLLLVVPVGSLSILTQGLANHDARDIYTSCWTRLIQRKQDRVWIESQSSMFVLTFNIRAYTIQAYAHSRTKSISLDRYVGHKHAL